MNRARLAAIFGRGRVSLVDDTGPVQELQIDEGSIDGGPSMVLARAPRIVEFGFASAPPLQSDVVSVRFDGDRAATVVIATNHQPSRPTGLQPGDSVLYDIRGAKVLLTAAGMTIDAADLVVTVRNAAKLRCECDVETTGDVRARADGAVVSLIALHEAYDAHAHGGVAAGASTTATTDHPA